MFDGKVKLIKYDYATSTQLGTDGAYSSSLYTTSNYPNYKGTQTTVTGYFWNNDTSCNTWSKSNLNTVNLNKNYISYLNGINTKWPKMIIASTWKVGGNTWPNIGSTIPVTAFTNEITNPVTTNTTDNATEYGPAQIGLMYVSDYGFAASPSAWTTNLSSYSSSLVTSVNWMYMGLDEWTLTRFSTVSSYVFYVCSDGVVNNYRVFSDGRKPIRPTFYLNSSVTYKSGTGTSTDPIILGD